MVQTDEQIVTLIRSFADSRAISLSYASMILTGSGDTVKRIEGGMSLTGRRAEKIVETAAGRWPSGLPWPEQVPRRSAAAPGSVASAPGQLFWPQSRKRQRDGAESERCS